MKEFFTGLLQYSHHYNQQMAATMAANPDKVSEKAARLLCHITNAQQIWNVRINETPPGVGVWEVYDISEIAGRDKKNFEASCAIVNSDDLDRVVAYVNSQGGAFSNTVRDILFHAINHSTYHRAQIATELKQAGLPPPITDYIFYKR